MDTILINNITVGDLIKRLEMLEKEPQSVLKNKEKKFNAYGCMEFDSNQTDYESKSGKFQIGVWSNSYEGAAVISFFLRCIIDELILSERLDDIIDMENDNREYQGKEGYDKSKINENHIIKIISRYERNSFTRIDQELLDINDIKIPLRKILFEMHKYTLQEIKDYYSGSV